MECLENFDSGLFAEQTCYILSVKILVSGMLAIKYPRGTAGRAVSVPPKKLAWTLILILGTLDLNLAGQECQSQKSTDSLSLELTKILLAAQGGRESRHDLWTGQHARPKQQLVNYAHSETWWVQPWPPHVGS